MDGRSLILLAVQAALALAGLGLLRRRVLPALAHAPAGAPSAVGDVWGPLAIVGPMLFLAARVGDSVAGAGWVPIGGPILAGVVAIATALGASARAPAPMPGEAHGAGVRLSLSCAGAGAVLLLLAAAHELTIWTGQCVFAIAAVFLWQNTPDPGATPPPPAAARGERWIGAVLACAAGQGLCAILAPAPAPAPAAAPGAVLLVLWAVAASASIAGRAGPAWAMRMGGWSAVLGSLLGVGTMSVLHLMPQFAAVLGGRRGTVAHEVARGFGAYALEALVLLTLPGAWLVAPRLGVVARRAAGTALLLAAGALAAWRLLAGC